MLEKLLLAASITFSLNMFVQVRVPLQNNSEGIYPNQIDAPSQILVTRWNLKKIVGQDATEKAR